MEDLKKLYIKHEKGFTELEASNYFLDQDHPIIKEMADFYFSLPPDDLSKRQEKMTAAHCYHEMNFQTKDESGKYGQVVATPFHGFAPITKRYLDDIVQSTAALLSVTRKLLQNLFSNEDITILSLGLETLPKAKAEELISIIKKNIYYEPKISHPSLKSYPFLSIVGFDCAVSQLKEPENIFFEFNAGTPCGIEDQYQLYEHAKDYFPEIYKMAKKYMAADHSHQLLKETIDACALKWTGNSEGISVILSPGAYNPAHPEIAAIASRSHMPLVKINDLYIDSQGQVRLNVMNQKHPVVTGIYNRKEESFLIYSEKFEIPLRSPFTSQNKELAKKHHIELKEGILYSYIYDQDFNIIDVEIDQAKNKAKYQVLFEQISPDPQSGKVGDLIQAVWEKKLYISNLGGRVFDDKRAFRVISDYLVPRQGKKKLARPPEAISLEKLPQQIDQAVIKAPDLSGGAGISIGAQLTQEEKEKIIQQVKANPKYYETQELSKLAVITTFSKEKNKRIPLPIDWRLIISFGPDEGPKMSTHSCLVRTAPFGSLKTNTSAGGGYALGLILNDKPINHKQKNHLFSSPTLTKTRYEDLKHFLQNMDSLLKTQDRSEIESLTYQLRDIMDLIGLENIVWINSLRDLMNHKIDFFEFERTYQQFLKDSKIKELI